MSLVFEQFYIASSDIFNYKNTFAVYQYGRKIEEGRLNEVKYLHCYIMFTATIIPWDEILLKIFFDSGEHVI